jgi:hypothetical protein
MIPCAVPSLLGTLVGGIIESAAAFITGRRHAVAASKDRWLINETLGSLLLMSPAQPAKRVETIAAVAPIAGTEMSLIMSHPAEIQLEVLPQPQVQLDYI